MNVAEGNGAGTAAHEEESNAPRNDFDHVNAVNVELPAKPIGHNKTEATGTGGGGRVAPTGEVGVLKAIVKSEMLAVACVCFLDHEDVVGGEQGLHIGEFRLHPVRVGA